MSNIFLAIVLVTVFIVVFTAVFHIFLRVPYVPTPMPIVQDMICLANLKDHDIVYDLGAGDGRFLIEAKAKYPHIDARGCEMVPTVWFFGKIRIFFAGVHVRFRLGNALYEDVGDADVVFLYLLPSLMNRLEQKFNRELPPKVRVLSLVFRFAGRDPVAMHESFGKKIYVYEW